MKWSNKWFRGLTLLSLGWLFFQFYIIFYPQIPLIQKPVHVAFALAFCFLAFPFSKGSLGKKLRGLDWVCVILSCLMGAYFVLDSDRILNRMTFIDDVLLRDYIGCILLTLMLLEGTRRTTGNSLVYVLLFFLVYAFFGPWFPGWLKFKGMNLSQFTDVLFLSDNGIFGIPTGVSVDYLFYFVLFGSLVWRLRRRPVIHGPRFEGGIQNEGRSGKGLGHLERPFWHDLRKRCGQCDGRWDLHHSPDEEIRVFRRRGRGN